MSTIWKSLLRGCHILITEPFFDIEIWNYCLDYTI